MSEELRFTGYRQKLDGQKLTIHIDASAGSDTVHYACYLYRNGERIKILPYSSQNQFEVALSE